MGLWKVWEKIFDRVIILMSRGFERGHSMECGIGQGVSKGWEEEEEF